MQQPKSVFQLRAVFGLARAAGLEKPDLNPLVAEVTGERTEHLSELSFAEANALIVRLGGRPLPVSGPLPRRTVNYRKQRAGVKTIETARHLDLIERLAQLRNLSTEGLEKLCLRTIKRPAPITTAEGNKIVEALKSMCRRDGLLPSPPPKSGQRAAAIRRAA